MKISRTISLLLAFTLALMPVEIYAKKKKDNKNDRQQVVIEEDNNVPNRIPITKAADQLYGEWNIVELDNKAIVMPERPYLLFDFAGGNRLMGHTGCNALNGRFDLKGDKITFKDLITTENNCSVQANERAILKALQETHALALSRLEASIFMTLLDKKGHPLMKLRRQNIDFLNGGWIVKELGGDNIEKRNIKLVADVDMLTVNANSGCNIINGVITINPMKEFAVEFEDLVSSHNPCPNLAIENRVLIALEETAFCKKISDNETALLDKNGKTVILLKRLTFNQLKN